MRGCRRPAVCNGVLPDAPLLDGCRFKAIPAAALECEGKRNYWEVLVPRCEGVFPVAIHQDCVHNEYTGLVTRHLAPVRQPRGESITALRHELRWLSRRVRAYLGTLVPVPHAKLVANYRGAKRRVYQRAMESLVYDGLSTKFDARVKSFVKGERRSYDKLTRPRIIQHRSPRYALELQSYIKAVENGLMLLEPERNVGVPGTRLFARRVDLGELAELIRLKFTQLGGDVVSVAFDAVAWDGHVSVEMLRAEHSFYEQLFPGDSRLQTLLSWQLTNHCVSRHGLRYTCPGTRMSGDANTSVGNSLLAYACVRMVARAARLTRWDCLVNGDDVVVFLQRSELPRFTANVTDVLAGVGQDVIVGPPCDHWTEVVMGRAKPILGVRGYFMGRDPFQIMSTAFVSHKHYHEPIGGLRAIKTIALGLLVLYEGVPVIQAYARSIVDKLANYKTMEGVLDDETARMVDRARSGRDWDQCGTSPISLDSRLAYYAAFGLSADHQRYLERQMDDLVVDLNVQHLPAAALSGASGRIYLTHW